MFLKNNDEATEALIKKYQLPFKIMDLNEKGEKPFLNSTNNRVGDKQRSPWTNKLWPSGEEADDSDLRGLELMINEVWDSYKNLYYGSEAVGSVYLTEAKDGAFQGVFCIQKDCDAGIWSGIHHVHVGTPGEQTCNYRVESAVVMIINPKTGKEIKMQVSASMSKDPVYREMKVQKSYMQSNHIENLGTMIEEIEMELRSSFETVCLPKTHAIIVDIQKQPMKYKAPAVNPLMNMMMNSDMLKKRLAKQSED